MNGEIVISETPNWLKELEEKREKRLKAKLGHEAGAGAPCLKCVEDCPGLDLHFWRKTCKICRCPKEEHDVHDDDISSWAQFKLLGSRPNKVNTKIVLNGNTEIELEWTPKGQQEIVDNYLKTVPQASLPVKGSLAAQERKQMLQKQIPVHDIDPSLCHDLNEEETKKMEEYVAHVKQCSIGVGQIIDLSSIIRGTTTISPQKTANIIASRYTKSVPYNEIQKLQTPDLSRPLEKLSLTPKKLPENKYNLSIGSQDESRQYPIAESKYRDIIHPLYENNIKTNLEDPQYVQNKGSLGNIGDRRIPKVPSQYLETHMPYRSNYNQEPTVIHQDDRYGFENPLFNRNKLENYKLPRDMSTNYQNPVYPRDTKLVYGTHDGGLDSKCKLKSNNTPYKEEYIDVPYVGFFDANTGNHIHELGSFHPITGKFIPAFVKTLHDPEKLYMSENIENVAYSDPLYSKPLPAHRSIDPETGHLLFNPGYIDEKIGEYIPLPSNFNETSPKDITQKDKNKNVIGSVPYLGYINPNTGKYVPQLGIFDPTSGQYIPASLPSLSTLNPENSGLNNSSNTRGKGMNKQPLPNLCPNELLAFNDYVEPQTVKIGAIHDIDRQIQEATREINPGYNSDDFPGFECNSNEIGGSLSNVKLPECHHCKKSFKQHEFAVSINRANILFHADCFKCTGCNQSLADNIYFYDKETNNIYCGRDYAKIKGYPRCAGCDELIFTKEYCLAENSTFHLKHFCCFQCDVPLAGKDYTLDEEKPYCLPCFETSKAAKCSTCMNVIKPDEVGCQLGEVHFHAEDKCFCCIVCRKPLMGMKLLLRNEKLFCSHDCFNSTK